MVTDRDIYATALLLIRQHGADAKIHAERRAAALLADGDHQGSAVWRRVVAAVEQLQNMTPPEGVATH